nr:RNA-directed DNA polymerase, eukaryota, nucleotide-binding alpha-beta plait domain protein [Tanacetum cinerariifolium]
MLNKDHTRQSEREKVSVSSSALRIWPTRVKDNAERLFLYLQMPKVLEDDLKAKMKKKSGELELTIPKLKQEEVGVFNVKKVSHSIFVTNFPESVTLLDLWRVCGTYGTMVDVFIPVKRSKAGKRFAFVRFIKVINLDRLVKNLCTLWIGNYHLYVNQGLRQPHGSYAKVVNATSPMVNASPLLSSAPALVFPTSSDVFPLLEEVPTARRKFPLSEEVPTVSIIETFKIIVKGRVFMVRAKELFTWNPTFVPPKAIVYSSDDDSVQADNENDVHPGDNDVEGGDDNASTDDGVAETVFDTGVIGEQHSVDPFELYGQLNKRKQAEEVNVSSSSLSHL